MRPETSESVLDLNCEGMGTLRERVQRKLCCEEIVVPRIGEVVLIKDNLPHG